MGKTRCGRNSVAKNRTRGPRAQSNDEVRQLRNVSAKIHCQPAARGFGTLGRDGEDGGYGGSAALEALQSQPAHPIGEKPWLYSVI